MDDTKTLGYGGSAVVDGVQVLVTGGTFDSSYTPSYLEPYDLTSNVSRSKVKHADGTSAYAGSVSFDLTHNSMALLTTSRLLKRGYTFDMGIHDGENSWVMEDCLVTGLDLSGSPGGLLAATLSVVGPETWATGAVTNDYILQDANEIPLAYWYSGATEVRDWNFSFAQDVSPVYGNTSGTDPIYLKVGLAGYTLSTTTYSVQTHSTIDIYTSSFTLSGSTTSQGFAYQGVTELGNYTYTFETSASISYGSGGSDGTIIT